MSPTICLNMIVKNEAQVIHRCLDTLRPWIDAWVIVDTGSTDDTRNIIQSVLKDIPGELHERPWKNFGHNRTEAIRLAEGKADYLLLSDADMTLQVNNPDWKSKLRGHAYLVRQRQSNGFSYRNIRLIDARRSGDYRWCYRGATHEYVDTVRPNIEFDKGTTDVIEFVDHADGGSKSDKFVRDAALLEAELSEIENFDREATKPHTKTDIETALAERSGHLTRTVFYLAQTYRDMGSNAKSFKLYSRRAAMGGWDEEVWCSLFEMAKLNERMGAGPEVVTKGYLDAFDARPMRAEPLVELARFYRERKQYALAHLFASRAISIPHPDDILFVETAAYEWRAIDEFAVASYWMGDYRACGKACEKLLANTAVPYEHLARITENLNFALAKLGGR